MAETIEVLHRIKILEQFAMDHIRELKPWELRKNDRGYKVGDHIAFVVVDKHNSPTGMIYYKQITYLFEGGVYGLQDGFCIMTLK